MLVFAAGMAGGLTALGAAASAVIALGLYDAGASTQHGAITAWVLHTAFVRSATRHAGTGEPPRFTRAQIQAGLRQYQQDCLACHGAPGIGRVRWASGLTPTPPYLVDAGRHWTAAQLHWIIANGIKMTGMPAWSASKSDQQIWTLVAFVETLPQMSADDYARMSAASAPENRVTP